MENTKMNLIPTEQKANPTIKFDEQIAVGSIMNLMLDDENNRKETALLFEKKLKKAKEALNISADRNQKAVDAKINADTEEPKLSKKKQKQIVRIAKENEDSEIAELVARVLGKRKAKATKTINIGEGQKADDVKAENEADLKLGKKKAKAKKNHGDGQNDKARIVPSLPTFQNHFARTKLNLLPASTETIQMNPIQTEEIKDQIAAGSAMSATHDDENTLVLGKKKKKTKKTLNVDDNQHENPEDVEVDDDTAELKLGKKKKKQTVRIADENDAALEFAGLGIGSSNLIDALSPWPDYTYDEMLSFIPMAGREEKKLTMHRPQLGMRGREEMLSFIPMAGREEKKFTMHRPQVHRVGTKKTAIVNFIPICSQIKREPKHVLQFLLCELGTNGSIDSANILYVKGRFQEKHLLSIFTKYAREYVHCSTCKGYETDLVKDQQTRLNFVQCRECGCRSSVSTIHTGYVALIGKRKVHREKEEAAAGLA